MAEIGLDNPDEVLAQYLADPVGYATELRPRTITRLTELGEQAQYSGRGVVKAPR